MTLQPLDSLHDSFDFFGYDFSKEIWKSKYSNNGQDATIQDTFARVAAAIASMETPVARRSHFQSLFYDIMDKGLFMPAGRILAGAGTGHRITLVNCFVNKTIEDCMEDIMQANTEAALTMQQGGGMGTDFSTLRPMHAKLKRTGSEASGPLPFMDMWDSMCQTIMSAGSRRGAMMGTLICTHPDLVRFIEAKHEKGRMTNFNVSILVTDAFMAAVMEDGEWCLYFHEEPNFERGEDWVARDFVDAKGITQYVYAHYQARDLWELIMQSTYEFSEPGIIFIDEVNNANNLFDIETIACTNPCGEQPLPPYGACNLGAINLARFVNHPFQKGAEINYVLLGQVVGAATRFLDNVIDVSNYPLPEQKQEQINKRRIGLGISGLADMLIQLGIKYGSDESFIKAEEVMKAIAEYAYNTSTFLAVEKGSYDLFATHTIARRPFLQKVGISSKVKEHGLRNGVLLTIAPTGTTSIVFGNISSSCEPNFAWSYERKVRQPDNSWKTSKVESFITRFYDHVIDKLDVDVNIDVFVTAGELSPQQHVEMQSALQGYVDASISKTINCDADISFEDFKDVYMHAYTMGCKGCTTYRPSDVRGSILSTDDSASSAPVVENQEVQPFAKTKKFSPRPDILKGVTYKLKWPSWGSAIYMTINHDEDNRPYEVFFSTKNASNTEWMTAITLLMTSIFRLDNDPSFIAEELQQIVSTHDSAWIDGKNYGSVLAYIGSKLHEHFEGIGYLEPKESVMASVSFADYKFKAPEIKGGLILASTCPQCNQHSLEVLAGCKTCTSCGYSKCE